MRKQISVYVDVEIIKSIKQRALDLDLKISEYVENLIKSDLQRDEKNDKD